MFRFINSNYRLAAFALLVVGLAIILSTGPGATVALADGFGWGSPPQETSPVQLVADGFGWGAPAPVNPAGML
ncbi:hypothetical protein JOD64_004349 [Micromonospora luteifusca]|uniref:Uncharacterized protein n=1 Tax=Micromonospora luteifusca TaxID=709860 RepID=A0ABS2LY80_9ACTN|nr:hypothetical protein [Micromonospora luteifusca]MBM7493127.1 hypothetical protein [Micromonospora luteifusca]